MSEKDLKKYKETYLENLYNKTYTNESESGVEYPKNKISVDLYSYEGEYLNSDKEAVAYDGEKVKITNSKMELEDWQFVKKKKVVKTKFWDKALNDESQCVLSKEDFDYMLEYINK